MSTSDIFTVVFRHGSVVDRRIVEAPTIIKAARRAERMTESGGDYPGWSVYSITRGVTS